MQTSIIPISEIPILPHIYICQTGSFNYTLAKDYGYQTQSGFLAGRIEGRLSSPTWSGRYKDKANANLINELFKSNYSGVSVDDANSKLVFFFHSGYCLNLTGYIAVGIFSPILKNIQISFSMYSKTIFESNICVF